MAVNLKDKKSIYEVKKDYKKQNKDEKISSKKQTYNSLFDF